MESIRLPVFLVISAHAQTLVTRPLSPLPLRGLGTRLGLHVILSLFITFCIIQVFWELQKKMCVTDVIVHRHSLNCTIV